MRERHHERGAGEATLAQFLKAPGSMVITDESMMMTTFVPQHCALPFVAYVQAVVLVYV